MRIPKHYRWALAAGAVGLVAVAALWLLREPQGPYSLARFSQVRLGMAREEVLGVLGAPVDMNDDAHRNLDDLNWWCDGMVQLPSAQNISGDSWADEHDWATVLYDESGRVVSMTHRFVYHEPFWARPLDWLRFHLGLQVSEPRIF